MITKPTKVTPQNENGISKLSRSKEQAENIEPEGSDCLALRTGLDCPPAISSCGEKPRGRQALGMAETRNNLSATNRSACRVFEGKLLTQNAKKNEFKIMHLRSKPAQIAYIGF
jgi:hypothetical protein